VDRRIPLWPETMQAMKKWIPLRPAPRLPRNAELMFLTARGNSWDKTKLDNPISKEIAKLLKRLELHRPGLNFYSLRRTFRTVASNVRDEPAANALMGHVAESDDMAATYTQGIPDERLLAITYYVREWLFGTSKRK
jgi:integrase